MTMKKSELKSMIREMLKEELLRESNEGIINEKGFLSSLKPHVARAVAGGKLLSKETKETIEKTIKTVEKDIEFAKGVKEDGHHYLFYLIKDVPVETIRAGVVLDDTFKKGLQELDAQYNNKDNGFDRSTTTQVRWYKHGDTADLVFELTLRPKAGWMVMSADRMV